MRIAHFSDIHVTVPPLGQGPHRLHGKRFMGTLNYALGGRRAHFRGVEARIAALLDDVDAQDVDHAVCTGDLTAMAWDDEFDRCAALFGDRLEQPARFTVLPGNHDRYTKSAVAGGRFEHHFATVCEGGTFPFAKRIGERVVVVGIDVARPASLFASSGKCGDEQRAKMNALLDEQRDDDVVILALHYGILRQDGEPDRPTHGIVDWRPLLDDLAARHVDMIVHGHIHRAYQVRAQGIWELCAGSATDLHRACGYQVLDVDEDARAVTLHRREWDAATNGYAAQGEPKRFAF